MGEVAQELTIGVRIMMVMRHILGRRTPLAI